MEQETMLKKMCQYKVLDQSGGSSWVVLFVQFVAPQNLHLHHKICIANAMFFAILEEEGFGVDEKDAAKEGRKRLKLYDAP